MSVSNVIRGLEYVQNRYDAENDVIPGAPAVTWADNQLAECVAELVNVVDKLKKELETLKGE